MTLAERRPHAVGMPELRKAEVELSEREPGLRFLIAAVLAGSGARPPIHAAVVLVGATERSLPLALSPVAAT